MSCWALIQRTRCYFVLQNTSATLESNSRQNQVFIVVLLLTRPAARFSPAAVQARAAFEFPALRPSSHSMFS